MARLYSNENFPVPVVEELRLLGHDVLTSHEADKSNAGIEDDEVLAYAVSLDRAVITHNRNHFKKLHNSTGNHKGIVICSVDRDFTALAHRIHEKIKDRKKLDKILISITKEG